MKLAFDRSARTMDPDGRLHVHKSHISKATVNPYYGREIPQWNTLGLEPDKIYYLFRDPVELERGAQTFARLPILEVHKHITVDSMLENPEEKGHIIGAIGSDIAFEPPYLDADLCFWDGKAIAGVESGEVQELSCAYRYDAVMEPGEHEGSAYDGRMTNIVGSHLALVVDGRAGPDVIVADQNPFTKEDTVMKMTKLGKAMFLALSAMSPVLAADSALPALVGNADRKTFKKLNVKAKIVAMDEDLEPENVDNVIDALLDVEQDPNPIEPTPAAANTEGAPADKAKAILAGKVDDATLAEILALFPAVALDSDDEDEDIDKKIDIAKDSMRKEFREAADAKEDVREVVGSVAMDSAQEIYGFALDHLKVDRTGVTGTPALRALFKAATAHPVTATPRVAQDADITKTTYETFPQLNRFGTA